MNNLDKSQASSEAYIYSAKMPPHDNGAEQSVLGGLMIKNEAIEDVLDLLTAADFYRRDHGFIFTAICELHNEQKPFDILTMSDRLSGVGKLEAAGGQMYLAQLVKETPSAANIIHYAQIVHDKSLLRQLIRAGDEITESAYFPNGKSVVDVIDDAEQKVFKIADGSSRQESYASIQTLLKSAVKRIEELHKLGDELAGLSSGFVDFDHMTSGLMGGDLIIIAARPGMGKTSFAMNIAEQVAVTSSQPVAIFSMEMSGQQLAARMLSSNGRVHQQNIRTGRLSDADWPRITGALSLFSQTKIFIDDQAALSPTELRARARRIKRDHGLALIVVDYLQLMQVAGIDNRVNMISEISRSLKAIAKELDVPVIALSQLSRNLESRADRRPIMSDLRESGAIEQDADLVCFIYRDEYYNKQSKDKGTAEIIIGKQRNGPTGSFRLTFLGEFTRFENFSHEYFNPDEL